MCIRDSHCTLIPISNIASAMHAKDQYWFLLLIYTTFNLAQAIFLYTGFMNGIDKGLDEAAIIDGCGDIKLLTQILLPICKPIIATEKEMKENSRSKSAKLRIFEKI